MDAHLKSDATKYNVEWAKANRDKIKGQMILFWGGPFSQWAPSPFVFDEKKYYTAEHWMMWNKAMVFNDPETAKKILEEKDPKAVKAYGRAIKSFDAAVWADKAFAIVVEGQILKAQHNEYYYKVMKETHGRTIVEASPLDAIWGVKLAEEDPRAQDPLLWEGTNLLGFAVMTAQDILFSKKQ